MKSILNLLAVPVAVFFLCGILACGSKSAPKCSDPKSVEMVKKIVTEQIVKAGYSQKDLPNLTLSLQAIRTTDVNEKTGKQECACNLEIDAPKGKFEIPLTYISELTDKGDEFYVTVHGFSMAGLKRTSASPQVNNSAAKAHLKNGMTAMESYAVDHDTYNGATPEKLAELGLTPWEGVTLRVVSGNKNDYVLEAYHSEGNKKYIVKGPLGTIQEENK